MPTALDLDFKESRYPSFAYQYTHYMSVFKLSKAQAKHAVKRMQLEKVWVSETHQVAQNHIEAPIFGQGQWLSIKRRDKSVIEDRDELAAVLRSLLPGFAGFELLPAPSRLVDSANQYHIWAFKQDNLRALEGCPSPLQDEVLSWYSPWFPEDLPVKVLQPPAQDWRDLYVEKEKRWPGQEAALYWAAETGAGADGVLLVLPRKGDEVSFFPFGFRERLVSDESNVLAPDAKQRQFSGEASPYFES